MSWGIDFNVDVFISHEHNLETREQIENRIDELMKEINSDRDELLMLSSSTPKDIFPNSEDILFDIKQRFEDIFETLSINYTKIALFNLYLETK